MPGTHPTEPHRPPRRVLYIDEGLSFGGALISTAHLVKYLDPSRYEAIIHSEVDEDVLRFWFAGTARYHAVRRAFNYVHWSRVQRVLSRTPLKVVRRLASYLVSAVATIVNVPFHVRLARLVHRERVDIIHHSNGYPRLFTMLLGRPWVGTMQGIWGEPFNFLERIALKRAAAYILISRAALEGFERAGGPTEITRIIPNPCDPAELPADRKLALRAELGFGADDKVFAIFGRIVHWKGQKEFVQAALRVLERVPGARAILVGDAVDGSEPYLEEVKRIAQSSPHADRIEFLGYVQEVGRLYNAIDVAVHASIEPEPFGLVVIEAMGFGVPIIAANAGGPTEIVDDGIDGYLVDPRDTEELADRITRLLTDEDLRARMGERGREKVATRYHARHYAREVQRLYDEIA